MRVFTRSIFAAVAVLSFASAVAAVPAHQWSKRFGSTGIDYGRAVAVDGAGNIIAAGQFELSVDFGGGALTAVGSDMYLAKYAPDGSHLWSMGFAGVTIIPWPRVAADVAGNVIVVGAFKGTVNFGGLPLTSAGDNDIFVAKFSASGVHQWSKRFGDIGDDSAVDVAIDASSNILITGYFNNALDMGGGALTSAGNSDVFVTELDANGAHQWSRRFGDTGFDDGSVIADAGGGGVIVGGHFEGTVDFGGGGLTAAGVSFSDMFLMTLTSGGAHTWSKRIGSSNNEEFSGLAVDAAGAIAITGFYAGTLDFGGGGLASTGGNDIFIAEYDAAGAHQWSKHFGGSSSDWGYSVDIDASNNLVVTGLFTGTVDFGGGALVSVGQDIFIASYDAAGAHRWSKRFGAASPDIGYEVALDQTGGVVVTGIDNNTVDFGGGPLMGAGLLDVFLLKLQEPPTAVSPVASSSLGQNHPNPFNPATTIEYTLSERARAVLTIYDAAGALVARLDQGEQDAGTHRADWNGRDTHGRNVASGVYFYRLEGVSGMAAKRMVLLK